MPRDLYNTILENSHNGRPVVAGSLHEQLWATVLRAEDPRFHQVRLTRGDGGLDGVVFQDPITGNAQAFQAKFYPDLTSTSHRAEIVDALKKALSHPFVVTTWTLLIPFELSAAELGWLMGAGATDLRAVTRQALAPPHQTRADGLAIDYKDGAELDAAIGRHLRLVAHLLPASSHALLARIQEERDHATVVEREIVDRLRGLQDHAVREQERESRRSMTALQLLLQGWTDRAGMLDTAFSLHNDKPRVFEGAGRHIEQFSYARMQDAYLAEGLVPGLSLKLLDVHSSARVLVQLAALWDMGLSDVQPHEVHDHALQLAQTIRNLQGDIDTSLRAIRSAQ